jgi:hypothetical protein
LPHVREYKLKFRSGQRRALHFIEYSESSRRSAGCAAKGILGGCLNLPDAEGGCAIGDGVGQNLNFSRIGAKINKNTFGLKFLKFRPIYIYPDPIGLTTKSMAWCFYSQLA